MFLVAVSFLTGPPSAEKALPTLREVNTPEQPGGNKTAIISAIILAVAMIALYIIFS